MKHLRMATILIFGILGLSLPAMAQKNEVYVYNDDKTKVDLVVLRGGKTSEVTGTYTFNGKSCEIRGSYFPATGRVKARCQNDEGYLDVTGFRITNKDGFQLTIGNYTYALLNISLAYSLGLTGTWQIEQRGSGGSYEGKLYLKDETWPTFTGSVVWNNHQQGRVKGETDRGNVTFTIYYSDSLEGYYKGRLSNDYDDMVDGTARANKGGPTVSWTAKRISREAGKKDSTGGRRIEIPQKMEENEGGYTATWTLLPSGNQFEAKWSNGAVAILKIEKFDSEGVRIVRGDTSQSVSQNFTAVYTGTISGNSVSGKVEFTQNGRKWEGTWSATW